MRQVELLMIFTAIKFSIVVYSQGDNCHDCLAIEWLVFKFSGIIYLFIC